MLKPLQSPLHVVLVSPRIPPNTGNVARLCAVTGCRLELVEPLGFSIADRDLRRAGLDYWDKVFLALHRDWDAYLAASPGARRWLFTSHAELTHWDASFTAGDHLVFGSDLGQYAGPPHPEGLRMLFAALLDYGVPYEYLEKMASQTPAEVLGLEPNWAPALPSPAPPPPPAPPPARAAT